jgi:hypothetical protein
VAAGVLIFQNLQKFGPAITIHFENANGLDANQTVIRSLGPIPTLASKLNCECSNSLGDGGVQTDTKTDTNFPIRRKPA